MFDKVLTVVDQKPRLNDFVTIDNTEYGGLYNGIFISEKHIDDKMALIRIRESFSNLRKDEVKFYSKFEKITPSLILVPLGRLEINVIPKSKTRK